MENIFFNCKGPIKISEILNILNLKNKFSSNDQSVKDIKDLFSSQINDISFFHSKKYKILAQKTKASFCITTENLKDELSKNCIPILVSNVLISTSVITSKFYPDSLYDNFDHKVNFINETKFENEVKYGKNVLIGANVSIGSNCSIGHNTIIERNVSIGDNCSIGSNVILRNTIIKNV
jgi:UDP-3-O-[3-hydroxymyristoyl] glucosamine N-acyltransferase